MKLFRDARGAGAAEFALVMPAFLMGTFLMLDGARAEYKKEALSQIAAASARCAAVKPIGCLDAASVQNWTVDQASKLALTLTTSMVAVTTVTSPQAGVCSGAANMQQVTITYPFALEKMTLLPQSAMPANLTATACFPTMS